MSICVDRRLVIMAVQAAIIEVNLQLPTEQQLSGALTDTILGSEAIIDSLGVLSLLVTAEESVERAFARRVELIESVGAVADGRDLTVDALVDHVCSLLER